MPRNHSGPRSAYATPPAELVELRTTPPRERADAARNRAAVLDAAAALFREHGVEGVSMEAVAAAAGVGKGTLFRRFGDKAGLATALLDTQERTLQEAILFGPAPLGPAVRPRRRRRRGTGCTPSSRRTLTTFSTTSTWSGSRKPPRPAPATGSGRTGSGTDT